MLVWSAGLDWQITIILSEHWKQDEVFKALSGRTKFKKFTSNERKAIYIVVINIFPHLHCVLSAIKKDVYIQAQLGEFLDVLDEEWATPILAVDAEPIWDLDNLDNFNSWFVSRGR